jgi:phage terminase large subunit GpA-like protein
MAVCDTCGNDYDRAFTLTRDEESGTFDSFECAIAKMAPSCAHCGCRILGHGVEADGAMYCCSPLRSPDGTHSRNGQQGIVEV